MAAIQQETTMKAILAASLMALLSTQAIAAEGDMKAGSWGGVFCGAPATYEVQPDTSGEWVFEGKIEIRDTGEYDRLTVKQYSDNSLRIMRYLSGENTGKKQWARTGPPKFSKKDGKRCATFSANTGNGFGCHNTGNYSWLVIVY